MKNNQKRPRRLMRVRNKNRVNRYRNQQLVFSFNPVFLLVVISLKLSVQNTPEKVLARLRMHIEKLDGNTNFPITNPTFAALGIMEGQLTDLIDAVNAGNNGLIPDRDEKVKDAKEMIESLSWNIQDLSKGDEVKIKSAGFDVRKTASAHPDPGQVMNLTAKPVGPGKIKLKWDKEPNSDVYVIEQGVNAPIPGSPMNWEVIDTTRTVSFVIENLNPGQVYNFRVYGTNGNVDGNPSDSAEQRSL